MGEELVVKRSKRIVNCSKNTLKVPAKEIVQSIQLDHTRQSNRQRFEGFEEYNYMVHLRTGWIYYPSTSSSSSTHWQHDDWKSTQSWNYWRSSTSTEQSNFLSNSTAVGTCLPPLHLMNLRVFFFGLWEPASVPPRAHQSLCQCSAPQGSRCSWQTVCFSLYPLSFLHLRLDDFDLHCVFELLGHLGPFHQTLGCFLCVVILKVLGCCTSTALTVGWTCVFTTCSTIRHCFDVLFGDLKYPFLDLLYCASSTSVSLIILSASSSVSFSPTFVFTWR